MTEMIRTIHDIACHRNGSTGEPFHLVTFTDAETGEAMLATVFNQSKHVAVVSIGRLAEGNIAFGSNSFRADYFEDELRAAIAEWSDGESDLNQRRRLTPA